MTLAFGCLQVFEILQNLKPYLSQKFLDFVENTAFTTQVPDNMTYFGSEHDGELTDEIYKKFAIKINKVVEALTPEQLLAPPLALELKERDGGTKRWMLVWYCSYAEFKTSADAIVWYKNFFSDDSMAYPAG